ncbi:MAG: aspartate dehydrogenase [Alphaproteobacteria bacterium]
MKLALIGHGAIARQLLKHFAASKRHEVAIILDVSDTHVAGGPPVTTKLADLLATKPDLVVECAGHSAVDAHAVPVLEAGHDILIVSIGALADRALREKVFAAAERTKRQVLLPAGAVAGIDGLAAARYGGLTSVRLRSRKPPLSWGGAPGVEGVDLARIKTATAIFVGSADEAARLFPKNANVAATVALAGLGFKTTEVELIADPEAKATSTSSGRGRLRTLPDRPRKCSLPRQSQDLGLDRDEPHPLDREPRGLDRDVRRRHVSCSLPLAGAEEGVVAAISEIAILGATPPVPPPARGGGTRMQRWGGSMSEMKHVGDQDAAPCPMTISPMKARSPSAPSPSLARAPEEARRIDREARNLVAAVRASRRNAGGVDALLHEYDLSSEEGVVLMCLAEALLRVPDAATADDLIKEKIGGGDWSKHLGKSDPLFVNASTWGLLLTGQIVRLEDASPERLDET